MFNINDEGITQSTFDQSFIHKAVGTEEVTRPQGADSTAKITSRDPHKSFTCSSSHVHNFSPNSGSREVGVDSPRRAHGYRYLHSCMISQDHKKNSLNVLSHYN